jgi:hypothetical protein
VRLARERRLRNAPDFRNMSDLNDPRAFERASGGPRIAPKKEPPAAPRAVVDVFRGEKHVQEVFAQ